MHDWLSKFVQEWPVISGAPVSFATATLVAAGIIWGIVHWSYSTVLANKNAQIDLFQSRIADYQDKLKGATPEQAAGELRTLRDQLADTRKKLADLANPPRDENSVYQRGQRIGVAVGVQVDPANKTVVIAKMTVAGDLDRASNVEYRDLVLSFVEAGGTSQASFGLSASTTYMNAKFAMVGNRHD